VDGRNGVEGRATESGCFRRTTCRPRATLRLRSADDLIAANQSPRRLHFAQGERREAGARTEGSRSASLPNHTTMAPTILTALLIEFLGGLALHLSSPHQRMLVRPLRAKPARLVGAA